MEDLGEEWQIQEYSSSEESNNKVSWILEKGLRLGKKIVIAGFVISSAPLVIPPLVGISALGLAFSVPSGLFFASYACTEKLMSKLLPVPTYPCMLEYETVSADEDVKEEEDVGFGGEAAMEEEEKEQMEDIKGGVEMRIELVEDGSNELREGDVLPEEGEYGQKEVKKDAQEPAVVNVDESVKEEGYEEDADEYLEGEDEEPLEGIDVNIEGVREEGVQEPGKEESKDEQLLDEGSPRVVVAVAVEEVVVVVEGDQKNGSNVREVEDEGTPAEIELNIEGLRELREQEQVTKESKGEQQLAEVHRVVVVIEGDEKNGSSFREKEDLVVVAREVKEETRDEERATGNEKREEEFVRETTGLLEIIRDEGNADDAMNEDGSRVKDFLGAAEVQDGINVRCMEEIEKPFEDKNVKSEKLIEEMKGTDTEKRDETTSEENERSIEEIEKRVEDKNVNLEKLTGEMKGTEREKSEENEELRERRNEENVAKVPKEVNQVGPMESIIQGNRDAKNGHSVVVVGKPDEDPNGMINGKCHGGGVESVAEEEQKALVDKKTMMQGERVKDLIATDVPENRSSERKEYMIHSNAEARQISDASDSNLFDDKNAAGDQYTHAVDENPEENEKARDITADKSADFLELRVSAGLPESKHDEIASKTDAAIPSNEVLFSEEKIWEQIRAMRTIVGYKAALHATCIDELKALYIFTGIEPPSSFKDPTDLAEVNDKLQFLMSIVGVK